MGCSEVSVIRSISSLIDFTYYSSLHRHTRATITSLRRRQNDFHREKQVFITKNVAKSHNFPKMHSPDHFEESIPLIGSLDNTNTENTESLHIPNAKDGFRASSKQTKTYMKSMAKSLDRHSALHQRKTYIAWQQGEVLLAADAEETHCQNNEAMQNSTSILRNTQATYKIAKQAHERKIALTDVEAKHDTCNQLLSSLRSFITTFNHEYDLHLPLPHGHEEINVWESVQLVHINSYVLGNDEMENNQQVRAKPAYWSESGDPRLNSSGTFDTVLLSKIEPRLTLGGDGCHRGTVTPSCRLAG